MKERTKNELWGCLGLTIIGFGLFLTAYGAVSLFQDLFLK